MGSRKKVTVGYRYRMGLHFILCKGPVDRVDQIIVGEREAWTGPVTDSSVVRISRYDLFGGDDGEGGIAGPTPDIVIKGQNLTNQGGRLAIWFGDDAQTADEYLTSKLGSVIPAFRGVVSAVFGPGIVTANNRYIKPWWFRVERIHVTPSGQTQWYDAKSAIAVTEQLDGRVLIATHTMDVAGNAANLSTASLKASPKLDLQNLQASDVVRITPNYNGTYIAMSAYGTEARSILIFDVVENDEASETRYGTGEYSSFVAARAAYIPDELTGATRYRFGVIDPNPPDNTGGISLLIRVYRDPSLAYQSMNPAHIIRECLTEPYMRMAYPTSMIDDDSFMAAADLFYDEGMGLCLFWAKQTPIETFLQTVLDHCGAVYFQNPYTGKFQLKAIRGDYDVGTLDEFDETSIISVESFERAGAGEVVNEITVVYTDILSGKDAAITIQDNANIIGQGHIVSTTVRYPGLPSATLAARVAQRDLLASTGMLARLKVKVTRKGWGKVPGDVIKITWPKLGLSELVCRIIDIDYGSLTDGALLFSLVEDVFSLPTTSYQQQQQSGWDEPTTAAQQITIQDVFEAPYLDLYGDTDSANFALLDADSAYAYAVAVAPNSLHESCDMRTNVVGAGFEDPVENQPFTGSATLQYELVRGQTELYFENATSFSSDTIVLGMRLMVGTGRTAEWVEVADITYIDSGMIIVNRGIMDTTPGDHVAGTRVWIMDEAMAKDIVERATADDIEVRLVAVAGGERAHLGDAIPMTVTMDQRFYRPYPPGNLRIDGESYGVGPYDGEITVSWAHRDRVLQADQIVDATEGSVGPEAGTTYRLDAYIDAVLVETATGITGTSYAFTGSGIGTMRVEVFSVRDGLDSWQAAWHEFEYEGFVINGSFGDWSIGNDFETTLSVVGGTLPFTWSIDTGTGALPDGLTLDTDADVGTLFGYPIVAGVYDFVLQVTDYNGNFTTSEQTINVVADSEWANVKLLLNFDTPELIYGKDPVYDIGPSRKTVTLNGGVFNSILFKKFGVSSLGFDGSGYLTLADSSDWNLGSSDFCLEAWIYPTSSTYIPLAGHFANIAANANRIQFGYWSGQWHVYHETTGSVVPVWVSISDTITLNQWQHIAITRQGSTFRIFKNGVLLGSDTDSSSFSDIAGTFYIGTFSVGAVQRYLSGYMDDFRLTIGAARYTATFTALAYPHPRGNSDLRISDTYKSWTINNPYSEIVRGFGGVPPYTWSVQTGSLPSGLTLDTATGEIYGTPDTAETQAFTIRITDSASPANTFDSTQSITIAADASWSGVELLLGFNESTAIFDEGPDGRNETVVGGAQIDSADSRFGAASLLLDGSGDRLSYADEAALEIGSSDFTMEAWIKLDTSKTNVIAAKRPDDTVYGSYLFYVQNSTNSLIFRASVLGGATANVDLVSSVAVTLNEWHHVAVTRSGSNWRLFLNGAQVASQSTSVTIIDSTWAMTVGGDSTVDANSMDGRLDEFRFTKGTARYTAAFQRPTAPFPRG